jgi:Spy/CpxP family protein refolding chaperone
MKTSAYAVAGSIAAFTLLSGFCGGCGSDPAKQAERAQKYVNMRIDDELDDIKASPTQKTQIHALADTLFPQAVQLRADGLAARSAALAQLEQPKPDAAQLHALVDARIDAFRTFAHSAVDAVLKAHETLTPEQRTEVIAKIKKHIE